VPDTREFQLEEISKEQQATALEPAPQDFE
jgi:hypothetical protein